jgi:pimeloyl-ACP methyl ester carboxylesterase
VTARTEQAQLITIDSTDGTSIGLWKSGSGPSLLAVHGGGADHSAWDSVAPLLADSFTVYAMDRRGRGGSGDADGYAIEREFDDVASAADALPAPVHLYGHSFGGTCSIEAALRTDNVASLMLYEGGPKPAGLRFIPDEFVAHLEQLIVAGQREEALSTFLLKGAGVAPEELPVLRKHPAWPARVAAANTLPRELRAINDYGADMAKFSNLKIPTLLIVGSETEARRREMLERLVQVLPTARLAVLPGQRHAAHQTAPELFAATLREFLNSARSSAKPAPTAP